MKTQDSYAGILLKIERLRQNKGQKEICYGICVPSYLSKIERNLVKADDNILQQLFQRLDIKYCFQEDFIEYGEKLVDEYFDNLLYGMDGKAFEKLKEIETSLVYSPLAVDWLIIKGLEGNREVLLLLSELEEVMTERQIALYYIIQPINKENGEEILRLYKRAHGILNNSFSLSKLMEGYYILGRYDKVSEYSDQCISLALEEGNTLRLAQCYIMQGDVYASLNADSLMMPFYKRAIHLLQNTLWMENLSGIYYNIGATYLHSGKYELAMEYLNRTVGMEEDFLLNHKKALVKIRSGEKEEAQEFLEKMKKWLLIKRQNKEDNDIETLMYEEVVMEMEYNFLSKPNFIVLLENLMVLLKAQRHRGFTLFYRELLKEAYCKQRKYKKALELDNKIS